MSMNIPRPKITIDTNSFIYLFDRVGSNSSSFGDLAALVRYSLSGKLEMAVTTRAEGDLVDRI